VLIEKTLGVYICSTLPITAHHMIL